MRSAATRLLQLSWGLIASQALEHKVLDMNRGRQGSRQLTALLVLAIVTAASGLPHWHTAPLEDPDRSDILLAQSHSGTAFLVSATDADLFECAACVLQRILTHARTQGAEAPPQPGLQAGVQATSEQLVSTLPLSFTEPRGPPTS